jgi:Polyketide cyclase / dehydrase and lipid transport
MEGSATVHMAASADKIWDLIADVRNIGRFSPEVMEAQWLGGVNGPALGAKFRGHVKRNEIEPVYWTTCEVTAREPGREFGFAVFLGDRAVNNWHYRLAPSAAGTDVTESFRLNPAPWLGVY